MIKALDRWLAGYLKSIAARPRVWAEPRHLIFCLADHYEPFHGGAGADAARAIVGEWADVYPRLFAGFRDADGRPPRHTFFYPQEDYDAECLDRLGELCARGYGEVEVHLHHRRDTAEGLREKLTLFRDSLRERHGMLGSDRSGAPRFVFIHGNWALCNSRPDGDWCGVDAELAVLRSAGCCADMTFPSVPSPTQPRQVNALYYARDRRGGGGGGHDLVRHVRVRERAGDAVEAPDGGLLLVTGPLALNWRRRKFGLLPRIENGAIMGNSPPTPDRIDLWAAQHIHVLGRPEWVFCKIYTHGCAPANRQVLLGDAMTRAHVYLARHYNDGERWRLHYVTARELVNLVHAAEDGHAGDPGGWRDYRFAPPPCRA